MDRVLYTAQAVVEGGRAGHGRTDDRRLDVALAVPRELGSDGGPGTNPEQLFAVGYAACFESALLGVARGRNLNAADARITSRVGLGPTGHGGFKLSVSLDRHFSRLASSSMRRICNGACRPIAKSSAAIRIIFSRTNLSLRVISTCNRLCPSESNTPAPIATATRHRPKKRRVSWPANWDPNRPKKLPRHALPRAIVAIRFGGGFLPAV